MGRLRERRVCGPTVADQSAPSARAGGERSIHPHHRPRAGGSVTGQLRPASAARLLPCSGQVDLYPVFGEAKIAAAGCLEAAAPPYNIPPETGHKHFFLDIPR